LRNITSSSCVGSGSPPNTMLICPPSSNGITITLLGSYFGPVSTSLAIVSNSSSSSISICATSPTIVTDSSRIITNTSTPLPTVTPHCTPAQMGAFPTADPLFVLSVCFSFSLLLFLVTELLLVLCFHSQPLMF